MDLFDPKPELTKRGGQPHPDGVEIHQPNNHNVLLPSPFEFRRYGECGMEISEVLPQLGTVADELCLIRSMHTEHNNHPEGLNMLLSCRIFPGRPVIGSWITYALGSENQNLPAYIVLRDPEGYSVSGKILWSSGWLPALYQGVEFSSSGTPVHHLRPTEPLPPGVQREGLNLLAKLNAEHKRDHPGESELEARIQNYELAARMQLAATEVLDLSKETEATKKLYGLDNPVTASYGTRCLMARRLVESGVRFVQVFVGKGQPWDHHEQIKQEMPKICAKSNAFSLWFAGGGFKSGLVYGRTDDFGYKAVENRVSVPNLQATLLHLLGLDHSKLTYPHGGREETPTEFSITGASVVGDLLKKPPRVV